MPLLRTALLPLLVVLTIPGGREASAANGKKTEKVLRKVGNTIASVFTTPIKVGKVRFNIASKVKDSDDKAHLNLGLVAIGGTHAVGLFYAKGKKSGTAGLFAESEGVAVSPLFAVGEKLALAGGGAISEEGHAFAGAVSVAKRTAGSGFIASSWTGHAISPALAFGETGAYSLGLAIADEGHAVSTITGIGRVGISPLFAVGYEKAYGGAFAYGDGGDATSLGFAVGDGSSHSIVYAHGDNHATALFATGPRDAKKRSLLQVLRKLLP
jgi:hypothetical protein